MIKLEVIQKLKSLYTLSIVIVEVKKSDSILKMRLYNDVKNINNKTIKDAYPILELEMFFHQLVKTRVFTIINLVVGY